VRPAVKSWLAFPPRLGISALSCLLLPAKDGWIGRRRHSLPRRNPVPLTC